jgi:tellurite resistance protein
MIYKDYFDEEEWITVQFGLMWVFRGVAGADGKIDKEEQNSLTRVIKSHKNIENSFVKEVFKSLEKNPGIIFRQNINDHRDFRKGLEEVAEILNSKVSLDVALEFKKILIVAGIYVANSSGERTGSKISEEEVQLLSKLAFHLKITMPELRSEPTIDKILKTFITQ